jgi:tRNA(Ile)-lysidine synthase
MTLLDRVRRTLRRHHLASSSTRVVAALSGGPDSTALVHLLRHLHDAGELQFVAIAHLNHQLREAADAEAQFCASIAADLKLPFLVESVDVRAVASEQRRSLEDAAHGMRYEFYSRALAAQQADVVALGHTRDDQAETFLLRLIRGAGSRGLAGMYPRAGDVIRPLLECSKSEVHAFLSARGVPFVRDVSNDDVGIPRNRVRAELLPLLVGRFNPNVVQVLAREADLARADQELLDQMARDWCTTHARATGPGQWRVAASALASVPEAIGWRALHILMCRAASARPVAFEDVRRAWAVATGEVTGFDAPGQRVQRDGSDVVLTGRPAGSTGRWPAVPARPVPAFSHPLPVPGEVAIPEIGRVMSAEVVPSAENVPLPNGTTAVVPKERVAGGLAVRSRRPGDRLRPGASGSRKLQDLLVDRKVPRDERDRVPIVVDSEGRIVWVAGLALDRDFQVTDPTQAVVILRLKGVGGSC